MPVTTSAKVMANGHARRRRRDGWTSDREPTSTTASMMRISGSARRDVLDVVEHGQVHAHDHEADHGTHDDGQDGLEHGRQVVDGAFYLAVVELPHLVQH